MKNNRNFCHHFLVCIFWVSLVLQSCSNLTNPIIPIQEKEITANQQVSQPEEEPPNLIHTIADYPHIISSSTHVAGMPAVEQPNQFIPIQECSSSHLTNNLSIPTAHSQDYTIQHQPDQPTRKRPTKQNIVGKWQHSQSALTMLIQVLLDKKFITQEGYQLKFYQEAGIWKVKVREQMGSLSRKHELEVYVEKDIDLRLLAALNPERETQFIHVHLPNNKKPGYVWIGNKLGLKGGGNGKEKSTLTIPGYQLLNCLHGGVSSNIYRAIRLSDECPVVMKVSTQKALTEKKSQRFQQEFALGQQVDSPYVTRYLELKQDPSYGIALVMEDDQAVELTSIIPSEGFSNHEFLAMAIQIVGGLQAIHAANIIHNDLKLSNILIQPITRAIKIIDFNRSSTLRQGMFPPIPMMVGTLAYISPEQTGRVNRSVDYRTDFYSLGIIFYRLLYGELPFTANDALELIHQHLAKQPSPPHHCKSTIALPLSQIVMKLLEKEAENRYQSCEGILHDLRVCLSALDETGPIPAFELGQQDFSSKLTLSQHLYGREKEIKDLEQAFECVSEGKCEALMVAGQPGVGKTMLIQEIQKPIALKQGYFITGKFDQLNKNVAYSAITQAFNGLTQQWLTEDEIRINQWKTQLLTALGAQASLLIKVVPALASLIGEQPEMSIADINQAKNVFNWIFQEFIKVCATVSHPVVIFLDDLQWADQASLELMTYLLQQPSISHLLWIGAYRDTEVTASHPALQAIATLQEASICIQTLTPAPLQLASLCQWIADSLRKSLTDVHPLGELIFQKTAGNPFFVKVFLQSLYDEQLLTFSPQTHWQWDINKIRQHPATENVIALMTYQIQQLPAATQQALSIASCLGHRLAVSILQTAMDCSQDAIYEAIQPALNSGILIQTDHEVYFAHDRVQEAAYGLLAETEEAQTHLTIGKRLLTHLSSEETLLFDIVAQFNRCRSLVTDPQERLQIARLNLKAGQKSKQATAYAVALDYLRTIPEWIDPKTFWQTDYLFGFTFHKELVEMEYLNGHMDASQALIADMQPHLQSTLDKVDIYHLLIIQKTLLGQYQEAINLGQQALQLLGSGLPAGFFQREMPLLKQRLAAISLSDLLNAPRVVDPEKQALFKILASIYAACYMAGSELLSATGLMLTSLSLTYGHTPESCFGYAFYGYLLCTKFEEYALAYQFGDLAIQLAESLQSPVQLCRNKLFMFNYIYPWSKSIQQLPALFTIAYESGFACGEIEYAGYCVLNKALMLFYQGSTLAKVQQEILSLLQFAYNTKNQIAINNIQSTQRVVANLGGNTLDEWNFDFNAINEIQFEEDCQRTNGLQALCVYYSLKAQAFYLYGHFKQASNNLIYAKKYLILVTSHYVTAIFNWYDSLTRLALYPTASVEEQQAHLQQITQNQQQMQKWQSSCPENFTHKYALVEAELARIQGDGAQAEAHYDEAIELAGQHGFIQEQALAAELAAQYWLARGKSLCAQGYLNIAFNGYKQWGAKRKLMQFKVQYADLLQALAPPGLSQLATNQETALSSNTLKLLDLSSILKSSHTISSEIELPRLLHKMMQIIIENAGAQQGALLFVEADDTILVQAEYAKDGVITTLQNISLADWANGACTVIQYVKRLHQSIVIDNATTHAQFKMDPYISRTQAKSILCVPLLKQTELKAILYVENNLMTHAFTPEHVQTVLILTAQMVISLENARYFAEQIVLTRQIEEKERQRAEEAERYLRQQEEFIDTVCHEIRNPMTGIYGNVDFLRQIITALETSQATLPASSQTVLAMSLEKLKESTETIEHCVKHQKNIIDDVLDLSKLEAGKVELVPKSFKLHAMIEEATHLFTSQLAAKSLDLMVDLPKEVITIKGDLGLFKIILRNLISNAVKFTEKGHVKISLQIQAVDFTHVRIMLSVEDTGIGMTSEEQSRLFQRFSRSLSSQYEGSGLGLVISKKLLDLMGGSIQVISRKGHGSTFTIHLTCESASLKEKASPLLHRNPSPPLPILPPVSKHILVVEDNKVNQKILCRQLGPAGYTCTVADNGQKAIEAIGAIQEVETREQWNPLVFDLILMDLEMPVMGGVEATQLIRKKEKQLAVAPIPIVGVSAYAREVYNEKAKQAGMDDYTTKPYRKEELLKIIRSLTSRP